jgi:hypothetical protein
MPGTNLPGVITAGTYRVLGTGERNFWDVCRKEKALVFELRDEPYTRLIVEVEDPFTTIEKVRRAIDSQGMTRRSGNQRA